MSWTPADGQVEAAAQAIEALWPETPWPGVRELPTAEDEARAVLVAVGPTIAASALRDVHDEVVDELGLRFQHAWQVSAYIAERADQIEKLS